MSWNNQIVWLTAALLSGCSIRPAVAAAVCPVRAGQPLRFVDVFDGPPVQLALLMPDKAEKQSGYWLLDYVFDAGRFVVVRCKYDDKQTLDVKLSKRVHKCDYKIDAAKALDIFCK